MFLSCLICPIISACVSGWLRKIVFTFIPSCHMSGGTERTGKEFSEKSCDRIIITLGYNNRKNIFVFMLNGCIRGKLERF